MPVQPFCNTGDQQEMVVCQGDVAHKSILIFKNTDHVTIMQLLKILQSDWCCQHFGISADIHEKPV